MLQDDGLDEDIIALDDTNSGSSVMEEIDDDEDDLDELFEDEPEVDVAETVEPATGLDLGDDSDLDSDLVDA